MNEDFDKMLMAYVSAAEFMAVPQLHVFALTFNTHVGWRCTIQESRFTEVIIGKAISPSTAIQDALDELSTRNEKDERT